MMLNKLAEWRDRVIDAEDKKSISDDSYKRKEFRVIVSYDKERGGYKLHGSVDGVPGVWVSSQRNEIRIFKTLDNLAKSLLEIKIHYFEVIQ